MFFFILGLVLWIALAFWPAMVAKKKGYSFILFLIASWFISFVITLIVALILKDKTLTEQDKIDDAAAEAALDREENQV